MAAQPDLLAFLRRLTAVLAAGAALAATPLLARLLNLQPPLSFGAGLSAFASILIFISALVAFCWGHAWPAARCRSVAGCSMAAAALSGVAYIILYQMLTIDIGHGELKVRGFFCQDWAAKEYPICPRLTSEELGQGRFNPAAFYTSESLAQAEYALLLTWLVLTAGFASGVAWVVAALRNIDESPPPATRRKKKAAAG